MGNKERKKARVDKDGKKREKIKVTLCCKGEWKERKKGHGNAGKIVITNVGKTMLFTCRELGE